MPRSAFALSPHILSPNGLGSLLQMGTLTSLGQVVIMGLLPLCPMWVVNGTAGAQGVPGSQGLIHLPPLAKAHSGHCPFDL